MDFNRIRYVFSWLLVLYCWIALNPGPAPVLAQEYRLYGDMSSHEAVAVADRIISWQLDHGGWSKGLPIATESWTPGRAKSTQFAGGVPLGTIDNGATVSEMRFLALVYAATGEARFRDAFLRGLEFLLVSQYPSGGWPQVYPRRGNYSDFVTFNDDAMINVLELFRDVLSGGSLFPYVDEKLRGRIQNAYDKGIDYILKSQIKVDGHLTGWCQQHDPVTYAPVHGRAYEHPSIAAKETVRIVEFLMGVPDPGEDIRTAVLSAILWLERVRLPSGEWARFYEIGSDRPIFSGRDGIVRYDIRELDREREMGYAWLGTWPGALLESVRMRGEVKQLWASLPQFPQPWLEIISPVGFGGASRPARGTITVEVIVEGRERVRLDRLRITVGAEELYAGEARPRVRVPLETTRLSDGAHTLTARLEYDGNQWLEGRVSFRVSNSWENHISMRAPEDQGWFGVVDHLKAVDRSSGWTFVTGDSENFFGDHDRLVKSGVGQEYLVWQAPRLHTAALTVFRLTADTGGIVLLGSTDGRDWISLDADLRSVQRSDGGWYRLEFHIAEVGQEMHWLRIEADESVAAGSLQLGALHMRGYHP